MTTFDKFKSRTRDIQDQVERHVWGQLDYIDGAGATIRVAGTGTSDDEAPVLNTGYSFNVPKDYNTEVVLVSLGSDTNLKYAMLTLPRDKQRQWKENTGGVQSPINPNKALEFNGKRAHLVEKNFALGDGGEVELKGGVLYIRCPVVIEGNLQVKGSISATGSIRAGGSITENTPVTVNVPGFEA